MKRAGKNKKAKNIQDPKRNKLSKNVEKKESISSKSVATRTRSKSVKFEQSIETKNGRLNTFSVPNTRSKSAEVDIAPLKSCTAYNTRSKSTKFQEINIDLESKQNETPVLDSKAKSQGNSLAISTIRFIKLNDIKVDAIVLAKQKYSFPWPAKILKIEKNRVFVHFFGDKRSGYVSRSEIYDFILSLTAIKSSIESKRKPHSYITGIAEVEMLMGIHDEDSLLS